jgi:uncharacterized membrane protein
VNENETPLEGATPQDGGEKIEETLAVIDAAVDAGSQAAADAAAEAEAAIETLASASSETAADIAEAISAGEQPAEMSGLPVPAAAPHSQENGARKQTLTDRLTESRTYDPDATNDDRIMAALAYASQLLIPLLLPIIILVSETSKRRPFQRYHAVQSIAVGIVVWSLELVLFVMAGTALGTLILVLCLCIILPAMIALWLLPLYYAMLAYNGKRFRIRGLTQFLEDQRWL